MGNGRAGHRVGELANVLDILVRQYEHVGVGSPELEDLALALGKMVSCLSDYHVVCLSFRLTAW